MILGDRSSSKLDFIFDLIRSLRPEGGQGFKKFDFLILCMWSILVEADLVEPKLAAKEIAFTQKVRFTFSVEIER